MNKNKLAYCREYWRKRRLDPKYREKHNKHLREYQRNRYRKDKKWRAARKASNQKQRQKTWDKLVSIYGNKCECCGQDKEQFLNLDHINNGGRKDYVKLSAKGVWAKAIKENDKTKYRILCWKCNLGRRRNGNICPHKLKIIDIPKDDSKVEAERFRHRKHQRSVWNKMIETYGAKCVCCKEDEKLFLSIDHIHGGGRKEFLGKDAKQVWKRITKENDKIKYRVLCFNCNMGRAHNNGVCPHENVKKETI